MAYVRKHGKTYEYTVSYTNNGIHKKFRKSGFKTKSQALKAALKLEDELEKMKHAPPLVFYFEKWVDLYKRNISKATLAHYDYTKYHINEYFKTKSIKEITRHEYQEFLNHIGSDKSKETVEKIHGHIKACVKDALEEKIISTDFTRKSVLTWAVKPKKNDEKHLNYNEHNILLKELWKKEDSNLIYSLLLLALTSGMRFGELVGLTRDDFDFENNRISINKTWGYMKRSAKGFGPTKNDEKRSIKMDKKTMEHFNKMFKLTPRNPHNLVFYNPNSIYKVINNTVANNTLQELLHKLNIKTITIHGLRHTHASVLLYKKVAIHYVSERLGHSDVEITMKKYTHVLKELRIEDERKTSQLYEDVLSEIE